MGPNEPENNEKTYTNFFIPEHIFEHKCSKMEQTCTEMDQTWSKMYREGQNGPDIGPSGLEIGKTYIEFILSTFLNTNGAEKQKDGPEIGIKMTMWSQTRAKNLVKAFFGFIMGIER